MEFLKKIPIDKLAQLRDLYKIAYPLHVSTCSTIQIFIDRFKQHPEWTKRVSFLSYKDDWILKGTFVMINGSRIFCNTLESFPYDSLRKALLLIEFDDITTFVNIRDIFRPIILDITRIQHFEVISDIGTRSFLMPRDVLIQQNIEAPEGFELKPVTTDHIKKINKAWPGRFANSEKFIEEAIKYNPSMGLYDKDGELVAWNMRIDNGSMGVGQADSNFSGNLYGHTVIIALAEKIAKESDADVHFEIRNGNSRAEKSARMSQLQMIDTQSWISIRRKKLEEIPMWGHL